MVQCLSKEHTGSLTSVCLSLSPQSILKKSVTMLHTPSAVYHYSDAGGGNAHHNKVNAIFQAAKKDLLQIIQIQVAHKLHLLLVFSVCKIVQHTKCTGFKYLILILVLHVENMQYCSRV